MKKVKKTAFLAAFALILAAIPASSSYVSATSISEAEDEREETEGNKEEAEGVLDSLESSVASLQSDIEDLDRQVSDIQSQITEKQAEADALNEEIEITNTKLAEAQVEEENQYAAMMKRIQYLYENDDVEYIDTLLSSASFTDMLNKSEYVEQISKYDQDQLTNLIQVRTEIEEYEATLESDLREVEAVQADLETQEADLNDVIEQKETRMAEYEADIEAQEALIAQYEADLEEIDERIAKLQAAAAASQSSSSSSSSTTYYATSGEFAWPVPGYSSISSYFGLRTSPTAGASSNHRGIDIPCPTGTDIIASASGTVTIAQYNSSCGNYIVINHGNGVSTVYMHNSQLLVSVGETVSQGQVIAKAGSTGVSTGSHCHFGIMINGTYVNPLGYVSP